MMLSPSVHIMARVAQKAWWKIAAKKAAEAAVKFAASDAGKQAASEVAERVARNMIEKKTGLKSLRKRLKNIDNMLKKGLLRQEEYEILRKLLIEETKAADL